MWHDFFVNLWIKLFGTLDWGGVNIGFWFSMLACVVLVIIMNLAFWLVRPKKGGSEKKDGEEGGLNDDGKKE